MGDGSTHRLATTLSLGLLSILGVGVWSSGGIVACRGSRGVLGVAHRGGGEGLVAIVVMVTVRGRRVRLGVDGHLVGHPPSSGVGSTDSEGGSAAAEQPNRDRRRPRSDPQIQGPSEMPNRRRMTSMSLLWNVAGCQGVRASGQQCQRPVEGLGAPVEDACCGRCGRCGRRRRTGCNTMGPLRVCSAYQRAGQRRENVRGIRGIRGAGPEGAEARVNGRGGIR